MIMNIVLLLLNPALFALNVWQTSTLTECLRKPEHQRKWLLVVALVFHVAAGVLASALTVHHLLLVLA